MDSLTQAKIKRGAKYTALTTIVAGLVAMVVHVVETVERNDYIGGEGTIKVAVPADNGSTSVFNDKLNQPLKAAAADLKMTQIKFKNDRVVQLFGEVNENSAKSVVKKIGDLNKKNLIDDLGENRPITLIINSPGGSVVDGALIVDAINGSKAPVNTLCIQVCASMAAFIHQYGKSRYVLPHAILMFHPASGGTYGDIDRMASELAMFQRYVGTMELNTAKRSGISIEEFKRRSAIQNWVIGEESVAAKLSDGVVYVNAEDTAKLFEPDQSTQEVDKKNKTKKVKSAFKGFLIQVLGASIQFINNSDDNSFVESIRRDFNDVPNKAPSDPTSDVKSVR